MLTTGGYLPYPIKYVIHASGPMAEYEGSTKDCFDKLTQTFLNCFQHANYLQVSSMAVPAISSGLIFFSKYMEILCVQLSDESIGKLLHALYLSYF